MKGQVVCGELSRGQVVQIPKKQIENFPHKNSQTCHEAYRSDDLSTCHVRVTCGLLCPEGVKLSQVNSCH